METQHHTTRIFLWRHPEVQGYKEGRFFGHHDVALSKDGREQVRNMARRMSTEKLTAVYCSDLQRTRLAAEAIARLQRPRRKPEPLPALRELNLGVWEGLTYKDISERYPADLAARYQDLAGFRIAQGESLSDLAERVVPAFMDMVGANKGGRVCVVAHAGVNRVILSKLMGAPLDRVFRLGQDFACLNVIDVFEDGLPLIQHLNLPSAPA
jgi:alpha-ribazole phosphatase/probable phosphoglycerate mutase